MEADENDNSDKSNREKITTGPSGLNMIFKSTLVHISVTTPLGKGFKCNTLFVGTDSRSYILLKLPTIGPEMLEQFFQEGFKIVVKAISEQGEGSIIIFRATIKHIWLQPIPILVLNMPSTMKLHQLRREPRFEVEMEANIQIKEQKIKVNLRDLSNNGCNFVLDNLDTSFSKDEYVVIEVVGRNTAEVVSVLNGSICNSYQKSGQTFYGVVFDAKSRESITSLLAKLIFDGSKMCFPAYDLEK
ncbi:MAG: flagellar brake protein [Aliivibrio sp.]|uniref:flagellar brake domain-containing protein n=1 Tax=Aliivibrio sp. TaxID=1872443 RepID=UPI001A4D7582|nr:flagellar brake protein [Aliivibrio sp.]